MAILTVLPLQGLERETLTSIIAAGAVGTLAAIELAGSAGWATRFLTRCLWIVFLPLFGLFLVDIAARVAAMAG